MRRLLRHLKPFTFLVILTLGPVFAPILFQSLALPSLMADIVDFGIARVKH